MPKNAVRKLQKIESDLKTIISIYDVTNKPQNDHNKSEIPKDKANLSQISTPKRLERAELVKKCQKTHQPNSTPLSSWEKIGSFDAQHSQNLHSGESGLMPKKWKAKKPGSAPTSSSTLSTICETDSVRQPSADPTNEVFEKGILSKAKTSDNLKSPDGLESNNSSMHEVLMTPSKTLQTAYEILAKNNYKENDDLEEEDSESYKSVPCCKTKESEVFRSHTLKKPEVHGTLNVKTVHSLKRNSSSLNFKKLKEKLGNENNVVERSRSVSPRKENSLTSKTLPAAKFYCEYKKNKPLLEISPKRSTIPRKVQRVEGSISDSSEGKSSAKARNEIKNLVEKNSTQETGRIEKGQPTKRDGDVESSNKHSKVAKAKSPGRSGARTKQENFFGSPHDEKKNQSLIEKERKIKTFEPISDSNNQQKTIKVPEQSQELWVNEFAKIIEISNEKLEKMKVSKELALDIAKHLKDKYDEIQLSNEELMHEMKKVEEDNERLSNKMKDISDSKVKLQQKIEGLKRDSKTKLLEQDVKTKNIIAENSCLKTKICELQKQYNEELLKKQKEIDKVQKERLTEIKNEIKSRESREDGVQRLKTEKSELQNLLKDRSYKIEVLEEKIRHLQEEVQKQKQYVKKKTERLEETNKELESIRQNSTDLEEQVKTLRKNIENFDEMQQNLMKQTAAYDQQIKLNQQEIAKLSQENSKLKTELENEKDALLIKTKIIEDQQETIKQLRDKSEETKILLKRNQSLERVLNIERDEKLELQEAVERLKWRKDELKKKVKLLENDLLLAPQEVVRDLQKTQIVLHELENQVQIKQKEWEIQFQTLLREKEQACSAAEFATKKLVQTTNEFQKQSQAYKRLHKMLAENLAEKERNLREVHEKKNYMQSRQSLSHVRPDDKISWLKDRHSNSMDNDDAIMNWYFRNSSCCRENMKNKSSVHFC